MVLCLPVYAQKGKTEWVIFRPGFDFKDFAVFNHLVKKGAIVQYTGCKSSPCVSINLSSVQNILKMRELDVHIIRTVFQKHFIVM